MISKAQLLLVCDFLCVGILKILFQAILLVYTLYPKLQRGDDARVKGKCRMLVYLRCACWVVSSTEMRPAGIYWFCYVHEQLTHDRDRNKLVDIARLKCFF
jgi:hypothetical protein